tara:strand:+ start:263 stop:463 length:201 start_codon:yes stop_codon:yes gene_type:complete
MKKERKKKRKMIERNLDHLSKKELIKLNQNLRKENHYLRDAVEKLNEEIEFNFNAWKKLLNDIKKI